MKRRKFLQLLGLSAATVVATQIPANAQAPVPVNNPGDLRIMVGEDNPTGFKFAIFDGNAWLIPQPNTNERPKFVSMTSARSVITKPE